MSLSHFIFQFSVVGSSFFLNPFFRNLFLKNHPFKKKNEFRVFSTPFRQERQEFFEIQFEKLWVQRHILQQKFCSKVRIFYRFENAMWMGVLALL